MEYSSALHVLRLRVLCARQTCPNTSSSSRAFVGLTLHLHQLADSLVLNCVQQSNAQLWPRFMMEGDAYDLLQDLLAKLARFSLFPATCTLHPAHAGAAYLASGAGADVGAGDLFLGPPGLGSRPTHKPLALATLTCQARLPTVLARSTSTLRSASGAIQYTLNV